MAYLNDMRHLQRRREILENNMKSFEQIAKAIYTQFCTNLINPKPWEKLSFTEKLQWVEIAQVAYKEITEVR